MNSKSANWLKTPVSKIANIILGGTPKTSEPKFWNGNIKWATAKDISECPTKRIKNTEKRITKLGLQKSNAKLLPQGTIIITARGTVGEIRVLGEPMAFNQTCYAIIPKDTKLVNNDFLYYALQYAVKQMKTLSYGTVFETITTMTFDDLIIPVPSYLEQCKIAEILGSLDDKIELNYEMNKTLEAIAQAIFKNWFVDFEPFKDELVYNKELNKEMPRSWEVTNIAKIADIYLGGTPKTSEPEYWNGNIKWASAKDVANTRGLYLIKTEKTITEKGLNNSNAKLLPANTIVITARGTVGEIRFLGEPMTFNQTCYGLLPMEGISSYYLFNALRTAIKEMGSLAYGTVFDTITTMTFEELKLPKPPAKIVEEFTRKTEPLYELIKINEQESINLAQIRDTLLPKLLSGEIRVKVDVEKEFPEEVKKLEEIREEKAKLQETLEKWLK